VERSAPQRLARVAVERLCVVLGLLAVGLLVLGFFVPRVWHVPVALSLILGCVVAVLIIEARADREFRARLAAHRFQLCTRCGYPLDGCTTKQCPDCGVEFEPEHVAKFWKRWLIDADGADRGRPRGR
jgi:hypothetical protein